MYCIFKLQHNALRIICSVHRLKLHHWGAAAHNHYTQLISFAGWLWVVIVTGLREADLLVVRLGDTEGSVELEDG